ncbi:kyphoscoliosis peptidase-like [Mytilus trossulus]|uniref:kyphoscoliosis peptidase-like n=1 Tax=Mytilus trossulus TaxID=6551 RepID=UPI003004DC6B
MGCCISKSTVQPVTVDKSQNFRYKNVTYDLKITYNDLKPIDDHALQTPKSVENSINELADYLAKPAKSELETIRSFYVWICNNISYNTTAYFSGTSAVTEASGVLKSKSSVCEGYANLFQALCVAKNIKCKKISGFAKGYGHQLGTILSYQTNTDHAWNVVFVSGKWRFIETTWGSGHIDENGAFVKNFSNFFFLTKPEHFIEDHYPYINNDIEGSKEWQLLKQIFSLEDFSKSLKTTKYARDWGVIFSSHRYEVVKVDKKASISMESKQNTLSKVSVNLYSSSRKLCNESVVMIKDNFSKYTVIVRPKEIGKYTLKVFGTIDQSQNVMPQLTEYMIECTSTEDEFVPYPEHNGFYGPSTDFKLRGFASSESISAFQICQNGEFELTMKTNKTFKCSADIFETDGSRSSDFVMVEQSNSSVCVKARFVSKGYYKITLFSEFEGSDTYSVAMNILVLNKKAAKIPTPFPHTYSTTAEYNCHLIEPIARNIPSNSNVLFVMSSPVIQELLIDGKVYKKENDQLWNITLKTGGSGVVTVSAKTDNNVNSYSYIYQYVVD